MAGITPIVMPKWGLSMKEGTVTSWLVSAGKRIDVGMPILEVETDKIANAVEAPDPGLLRRIIAQEGDLLPVKALLAVMAEADVSDAEIEAFVAAYVTPAVEDEGEELAPATQRIDVGDISIRYARRGSREGVPVLFIHGFGGDLDNWLFNIDPIAEKSPVIALDLPGHGQSSIRLPGTSLIDLASFIARFLDAIDVPKVHLVGHSMGGGIAAQLALSHPDRVVSLVLIDSAGMGKEISSSYVDGFVSATSRRDLKPMLEQLFFDPTLVGRQLIDDVLKYKRLDGVAELLASLSSALFGGGLQKAAPGLELGRSGKPVLLLWGREDRVIPAAHAGHAHPGALVEVLDRAGHMVQMERANDVNRLILKHLAAC